MLVELNVSNFAIIDNVHLSFGAGLNVLSGETGAGKSVLLKSLALLMGGKASSESIRTGCEQAIIEGCFDLRKRPDIVRKLEELGIPCEEKQLIVRRVIQSEKSRLTLNGGLSTVNTLRDVVAPLIEVTGPSAPLIELTGQHENRNLLSKSYHLDLLDQAVGNWAQRQKYESLWEERAEIDQKIQALKQNEAGKQQRLDFLIYQRDEIIKLDLSPGEDVELEQEVKRLKNLSRITGFVDLAEQVLVSDEDSATQRITSVLRKSADASAVDPVINEKVQALETAKATIDDIVYDLRRHISSMELDPAQIEEKEARLSDLRKLQKKFGSGVNDILQSLVEIESEISQLQNSESHIQELEKKRAALTLTMTQMAHELHKKRATGAKTLEKGVNGELADLNMKGVDFVVSVETLPELGTSGSSSVEFMTRSTPKEAPRALGKGASGGELSRILLSLKKVIGATNQPRTYLFDEVDTGISGETAEKVGKKLHAIGKGQQVICVTHLPQVAAHGDIHFFIQKSPQKNAVSMQVKELKSSERTQEIARLISGEKITKTSLAHAEQLLSR